MVPSPWHLTLTNLTATLPRWPRSFAWRSHKAPATVALVSASPAAMLKPWIASQNLKTRTVYVSWGFSRIRSDCSSQEGKLSDEMPEFPTIQKMPFGAFSRFKKKNIQLHTQIMVEMAPGIVHRDTSQIISNNGKDIHHNTLEPTWTNHGTVVLACTHSKYKYVYIYIYPCLFWMFRRQRKNATACSAFSFVALLSLKGVHV